MYSMVRVSGNTTSLSFARFCSIGNIGGSCFLSKEIFCSCVDFDLFPLWFQPCGHHMCMLIIDSSTEVVPIELLDTSEFH